MVQYKPRQRASKKSIILFLTRELFKRKILGENRPSEEQLPRLEPQHPLGRGPLTLENPWENNKVLEFL